MLLIPIIVTCSSVVLARSKGAVNCIDGAEIFWWVGQRLFFCPIFRLRIMILIYSRDRSSMPHHRQQRRSQSFKAKLSFPTPFGTLQLFPRPYDNTSRVSSSQREEISLFRRNVKNEEYKPMSGAKRTMGISGADRTCAR